MPESTLLQDAERRFAEFLTSLGGGVRSFQRQPDDSGPDFIIEADIRGVTTAINWSSLQA